MTKVVLTQQNRQVLRLVLHPAENLVTVNTNNGINELNYIQTDALLATRTAEVGVDRKIRSNPLDILMVNLHHFPFSALEKIDFRF